MQLQVLVSVFGVDGIARFAATNPPQHPQTEYLVSWQLPEKDMAAELPASLAGRRDIRVYKSDETGLSRNRNCALSLASGPYCLIADDDVVYTDNAFSLIIDTFRGNDDVDVACFKSTCCGRELKPYPSKMTPLKEAPKGWYATSFEIACRYDSPAGSTKFNTAFGVGSGTVFGCGEEDLWLYDARKAGAHEVIVPELICAHNGPTTTEKHQGAGWWVMTQGAVHSRLHPFTWPLRVALHAVRQRFMPGYKYFYLCIKGAVLSHRSAGVH